MDRQPEKTSRAWGESSAIVIAMVALVAFVDPRGAFPLDDDWNFALATWHLARTGVIRFARFTAMTLRLQAAWGALWTRLFGESFDVLRASVLFLSIATLFLFHRITLRLNLSRPMRLLAVAALLVHPIFFWASFTYMTHIPFLSVSMLAFYFFIRAVTEERRRDAFFVAGVAATIASTFVRQTGIALLIPPAVIILSMRGEFDSRWRRHLAIIATGVAAILGLFFFTPWLHGYPTQIEVETKIWKDAGVMLPVVFGKIAIHHLVMNYSYAALFTLPLVVPVLLAKRYRRSFVVAWLFCAIPFLYRLAESSSRGYSLFNDVKGNVLSNLALGPLTLRDIFFLGYEYPAHVPNWTAISISLAAGIAGSFLLCHVVDSWHSPGAETGDSPVLRRYVVASALAGTLILFTSAVYFDRYELDSGWPIILLLVMTFPPVRLRAVAVALTIVLGFFSILGTQEYLRWNRERWAAYRDLRASGVSLMQMDGGYEINQFLIGGFDGIQEAKLPGWSVYDDEYVITFNPIRGYRTVRIYPYSSFLGMRRLSIKIEKRVEGWKPVFE